MTPQEANKKHRQDRAAAVGSGKRYVVRMKTGDPGFIIGLELADDAYVDGVLVKSRGRKL